MFELSFDLMDELTPSQKTAATRVVEKIDTTEQLSPVEWYEAAKAAGCNALFTLEYSVVSIDEFNALKEKIEYLKDVYWGTDIPDVQVVHHTYLEINDGHVELPECVQTEEEYDLAHFMTALDVNKKHYIRLPHNMRNKSCVVFKIPARIPVLTDRVFTKGEVKQARREKKYNHEGAYRTISRILNFIAAMYNVRQYYTGHPLRGINQNSHNVIHYDEYLYNIKYKHEDTLSNMFGINFADDIRAVIGGFKLCGIGAGVMDKCIARWKAKYIKQE